jgi:hypothetical protein
VRDLEANPIALRCTAIETASCANQDKVRTVLNLTKYLLIEVPSPQSIDVEKWIKSLIGEKVRDPTSEVGPGVATIRDEDSWMAAHMWPLYSKVWDATALDHHSNLMTLEPREIKTNQRPAILTARAASHSGEDRPQ